MIETICAVLQRATDFLLTFDERRAGHTETGRVGDEEDEEQGRGVLGQRPRPALHRPA